MSDLETNEISKGFDYLIERLKTVKKYKLEVEVIYFALLRMKENPSLSIEDAFEAGCDEWDV